MTIHTNLSCSAGCVFSNHEPMRIIMAARDPLFHSPSKAGIDQNHRRIHRSLESPRRNTNPGTAGYNTVGLPGWTKLFCYEKFCLQPFSQVRFWWKWHPEIFWNTKAVAACLRGRDWVRNSFNKKMQLFEVWLVISCHTFSWRRLDS